MRGLATKAVSPEDAWAVCQTHLSLRRNTTGLEAFKLCDLAFMAFLNVSGSDPKPWTRFADGYRASKRRKSRTKRSEL